jgi:hypothetical protein
MILKYFIILVIFIVAILDRALELNEKTMIEAKSIFSYYFFRIL